MRAGTLTGAPIAAYAGGTGQVRFTGTFVTVAIGIGVASVAAIASSGRLIVPGVIVIVVALSSMRPRRGVAVTPDALLVLHESMVNALPNRVVAFGTLAEIDAVEGNGADAGHVRLHLGAEVIRMKRSAYDLLVVAVRQLPVPWTEVVAGAVAGPPPTAPQPVRQAAWFPDPTGRFALRFWDGTRWTAHVARDGVAASDPLG